MLTSVGIEYQLANPNKQKTLEIKSKEIKLRNLLKRESTVFKDEYLEK